MDFPKSLNALTLSHRFMAEYVGAGAKCVDATAGRGNDAAFLAEKCGDSGHIWAFDIQTDALASTKRLLEEKGLSQRVTLILDSHSRLERYLTPESIDFICFNFGWLPGGDHNLFTRAETSIAAIDASLRLLKPGGAMSLCVYYGRNNGTTERDAILSYLRTVDPKIASVLCCEFSNRPGNPAIPVFLWKGR